MASESEQFFSDYSLALNTGDAQQVSSFHVLPSVFVTDNTKQVCNQMDKVVKVNQHFITSMTNHHVAEHIPTLHQAMRLSDSVIFCNVKWRFVNEKQESVFSATCSYTLQRDEQGELKILVVVLDGDEGFLRSIANLD